jgi:hypothetical protein
MTTLGIALIVCGQKRTGPRHPKLGEAAFHVARWIAARTMGPAGFHHLGSAFADQRIAETREKLARGDTLYLAGIGLPGMHNSGVALVEVTQAHGPRLILNNEEERFSGNKHTTEYPQRSIDAMVATSMPGSRAGTILRSPARSHGRSWKKPRKALHWRASRMQPRSTGGGWTR